MSLKLITTTNIEALTRILQEADEDVKRIVSSIEDADNTAYFLMNERDCVGAVVMHWQPEESEILYIAVNTADRGLGYGKESIVEIRDEAKNRHIDALIVGTANSSLDNIAFYQKCGFRMDRVRKAYFDYLATPIYEDGILMRDMLVLRMEIGGLAIKN